MWFRGRRRVTLHRPVDLAVAVIGLAALSPVILVAWVAAAISSGGSGFYRQERIGRGARTFSVVKLRTMYANSSGSDVTTSLDPRVTRIGVVLRRTKLDELPQLINVLKGEMALLGPRPDVAGYADCLTGDDRDLLDLRPGISGPASILFKDEEVRLAAVDDPVRFNTEVLYPLKVRINRAWIDGGTLGDDCRLLLWSIRAPHHSKIEDMIGSWDSSLRDDCASGVFSGAEA